MPGSQLPRCMPAWRLAPAWAPQRRPPRRSTGGHGATVTGANPVRANPCPAAWFPDRITGFSWQLRLQPGHSPFLNRILPPSPPKKKLVVQLRFCKKKLLLPKIIISCRIHFYLDYLAPDVGHDYLVLGVALRTTVSMPLVSLVITNFVMLPMYYKV